METVVGDLSLTSMTSIFKDPNSARMGIPRSRMPSVIHSLGQLSPSHGPKLLILQSRQYLISVCLSLVFRQRNAVEKKPELGSRACKDA